MSEILDTIQQVLEFLTLKKAIIVGGAVTICEVITLIVNLIRRLKSLEKHVENITRLSLSESKEIPTLSQTDAMKILDNLKRVNILKWAINPLNLFRKPDIF
jgi:hypothetical protein